MCPELQQDVPNAGLDVQAESPVGCPGNTTGSSGVAQFLPLPCSCRAIQVNAQATAGFSHGASRQEAGAAEEFWEEASGI